MTTISRPENRGRALANGTCSASTPSSAAASWSAAPSTPTGKPGAPLDRPPVPVRRLRKRGTWLRGHRPCRPGPHRPRRPGVLSGGESRQHAYVALTRGTDDNSAYVFTTPAKLADLAPGPSPPPSFARTTAWAAQLQPRSGRPDEPGDDQRGRLPLQTSSAAGTAPSSPPPAPAASPGQRDHWLSLHAIWTDQTAPARGSAYTPCSTALPPGHRAAAAQ